MSYLNNGMRTWYRNLWGFCSFAVTATAIAVVLFAIIVVLQAISVDGLSAYILEGFFSALTLGLLFSIPIPILAVLVGYPLWLMIVTQLEERDWSRPSTLVVGSSIVSMSASLCYFGFVLGELSLIPDLFLNFLLITIPGIVGANISARLFFLKAE